MRNAGDNVATKERHRPIPCLNRQCSIGSAHENGSAAIPHPTPVCALGPPIELWCDCRRQSIILDSLRGAPPPGEGLGAPAPLRHSAKPQFISLNKKAPAENSAGACLLLCGFQPFNYSWGPAATRALPSSLPVYLVKFLMKRADRSFAFSSQTEGSA